MKDQKAKLVLRTFGGLMASAFISLITLKLCGILPWSWWWITAPVWGTILLSLVIMGLFALLVMLFASEAKTGKRGGAK